MLNPGSSSTCTQIQTLVMHLYFKDNVGDTSYSTEVTSNSVDISLLSAECSAEFAASSHMPQVQPSELNGHWFEMKPEKRCEVNEFHTPVSLKTWFWATSHSDWGWHVGNCAMLILHSKKKKEKKKSAFQCDAHLSESSEKGCTWIEILLI